MKYQSALLLVLILALIGSKTSLAYSPKDSLALVQTKEKSYIIHQVEKGETLSSLSRRYGCSVEEIKRMNKNLKSVKIGQKIKITVTEKQLPTVKSKPDSAVITVDESHANADTKDNSGIKKYLVQPGDNLNKIALKYKVSSSQIAKWNGLQGSNIRVGQELIVSGSTQIKPYEKWNKLNSLTAKSPKPENILAVETTQIEESGWVQVTPVCTHPSLSPGSMVLCINPDNQKQILLTIEKQQFLNAESVIGLSNEHLDQLDRPDRVIIKYNLP